MIWTNVKAYYPENKWNFFFLSQLDKMVWRHSGWNSFCHKCIFQTRLFQSKVILMCRECNVLSFLHISVSFSHSINSLSLSLFLSLCCFLLTHLMNRAAKAPKRARMMFSIQSHEMIHKTQMPSPSHFCSLKFCWDPITGQLPFKH